MAGFWDGREVLVTGGTGFLGGRLVHEMLARKADVTVLTRDAERAADERRKGANVVEGDVTEPDGFDIGEPDVVVHAAAWVAFGVPSAKEELFRATNVDGTKHVLAAAREAGVERFCHVSSVAAIGATPGGLYPEERAVEKRYPETFSLYEETKRQAHEHALENHGSMRTVLPMPGVVLGRGGGTQDVLEAFLDGKLWNLRGDNPTGYVHANDAIAGILLAIQRGEGPYVLNDRNLTLNELWRLFEEASGQPAPDREVPLWTARLLARLVQTPYRLAGKVPPLSVELVDSLEVPMTYSSRRAREELGWKPDLESHLEEDFEQLQS